MTAKYEHIADVLRGRIVSGEYGPGAVLPLRANLAAEYGVSEITVRKATSPTLLAASSVSMRSGTRIPCTPWKLA